MILLDTQVLIWFSIGDERLGKQAGELIAAAAKRGETSVSPISFWEAAMLIRKKRVDLECRLRLGPPRYWRAAALLCLRSPQNRCQCWRIANGIHGDPADRIIMATARAHACTILTSDRKILAYAKTGHLEAIDARR
jgi:PIN domain nuclease of toxin-antitoxin system